LFKAERPGVYSQPKTSISHEEIRNKVYAKPDSKIVLLAMSSMDEIFAVDMLGISSKILLKSKYSTIENQLDWIEHVISIVEKEPTIHLVIRIHPRELPNKREGVFSIHAKDLLRTLQSRPLAENIYLNLPDDSISLYDLFQVSSLVLNGNSTSGLEAAFLGIPVVIHHPDLLTTMPADFAYVAKSKREYRTTLMRALKIGKPNSDKKYIYRWYNFRFASMSSELVPLELKEILRVTKPLYRLYSRLNLPLLLILRKSMFNFSKTSSLESEATKVLVERREGINLDRKAPIFGNGTLEIEKNAIRISTNSLDKSWVHSKFRNAT
jgi:hypothetical protein